MSCRQFYLQYSGIKDFIDGHLYTLPICEHIFIESNPNSFNRMLYTKVCSVEIDCIL